MLDYALSHNTTVVYYAYIIAGLARQVAGLRDCDVSDSSSTSLCVHGADFIRHHAPQILDLYSHFANETASRLGRSSDTVWLIEPDWYQYSQEGQQGGGLTQDAMVSLYDQISCRIRSYLPRARLSIDVSPWATDQDAWLTPFLKNIQVRRFPSGRLLITLAAPHHRTWQPASRARSAWPLCAAATQIDFLHTSGGQSAGNSTFVRPDPHHHVTWRDLQRIGGGRGIIADTGYGVGGRAAGSVGWLNADSLGQRVAEGVVALSIAHVSHEWVQRVKKLRQRLPPAGTCMLTRASANQSRSGGLTRSGAFARSSLSRPKANRTARAGSGALRRL